LFAGLNNSVERICLIVGFESTRQFVLDQGSGELGERSFTELLPRSWNVVVTAGRSARSGARW